MPLEMPPPRAIASLAERFPALQKLWAYRSSRRIPVVRQLAATDCGAAALTMVLGYHGKRVPLDEIRQALGGGRHGTTAAALLRVGHLYGLRGRGVRAEIDDLQTLPVGTVLFWEFHHYVVLERVRRDRIDIVDPAGGRRSVPIAKLRRAFTGVALIFEPTDLFSNLRRRRSK